MPFLIAPAFFHVWLKYRRLEFEQSQDWVILEIKIPKQQAKSPRAMEQVISGFHGIYSGGNLIDKYWKGKVPPRMSLEIAGIGGNPHFFVVLPKDHLKLIETQIYAQYPKVELYEVQDYTDTTRENYKQLDWKVFGTDLELTETDVHPIRTYRDFGLEQESEEEEKIDPLSGLAEILGDLEGSEQLWIQYVIQPVFGFEKDAKDEMDKIAGRSKPQPPSLLKAFFEELGNFFVVLLGGGGGQEPAEKSGESKSLHEAEKKLIELIGEYASKPAFKVSVRWIYLAHKGDFKGSRISSVFGAFSQFARHGCNSFKPQSDTITSVDYFLVNWRVHRRALKLIYNYKSRLLADKAFRLTTESLASLYHFPGLTVSVPTLERVPARKVQPPANLPTN